MNSHTSRQQGNRRIAIGLALFAAGVFLTYILRQWMSNA